MGEPDFRGSSSEWTADGFVIEDRRRVVSHPDGDAAGLVERFRMMSELGMGIPKIEVPEVIAVRGERLAAVRIAVSFDGAAARMDSIGVIKFDPSITRMERIVQFDHDDMSAALELLDVLHDEVQAEN